MHGLHGWEVLIRLNDHIWEHNNRFRLVPVEGQKDQYDLIPVPGTVYQVGTPINKATFLQDSTYSKYKNASKVSFPTSGDATPNDIFNALTDAFAGSISIIMGESLAAGYQGKETEGFAKWSSILYDATGKSTLDTSFESTNYCTKLYVPKGIKNVQVTAAFQIAAGTNYSSGPFAKIYKNGSEIQSLYIVLGAKDGYFKYSTSNAVIDTTGSGSEYIQLYLKGENSSGTFASRSQIKCLWLVARMLNF